MRKILETKVFEYDTNFERLKHKAKMVEAGWAEKKAVMHSEVGVTSTYIKKGGE